MNRQKKIYAGIITLAVVCGAIPIGATLNTRREAGAFLSELKAIQLGPTGYEQVQALAIRFRSHVEGGTKSCVPSECSLTLKFENTWLRRLHLATWTTFAATLLVRDGQLYYVSTGMTLYSRERVIGASTTLLEKGHGGLAYSVVTKRWADNQPWQVIVQLTPQATPGERKAAFFFNLDCLDKLGGCKDSSDLLPSVWREDQEHGKSATSERGGVAVTMPQTTGSLFAVAGPGLPAGGGCSKIPSMRNTPVPS